MDKPAGERAFGARCGCACLLDIEELLERIAEARPRAGLHLAEEQPAPAPDDDVVFLLPPTPTGSFPVVAPAAPGSAQPVWFRVVRRDGAEVARGEWLQPEDVRKRMDAAKDNLATALEDFTLNTLSYVRRDRDLLLEGLEVPTLKTRLRDRHVLVVVRGHDYKKDLSTLRGYIQEFRPALIGVDGGADALLEVGLKPDVILGDMDSVTNEALTSGG